MTSGDNLKEQERTKLHNTIWRIANELRGSVDGWDFKAYVLGFLFYRFISENLVNYINAEERKTGVADFKYAELSDDQAEFGRKDTVNDKGFYILFTHVTKIPILPLRFPSRKTQPYRPNKRKQNGSFSARSPFAKKP